MSDEDKGANKCPFCMRDMPEKMEDKTGFEAVVSALDSVRDILGTMRAVVMEMQRGNNDDER